MDFNIEVRKKQLENLDQLIASSRNRVQSVLSYLGWTSEKVQKEDNLVQCPVNPHHRINPQFWNQHIEKCVIKLEGYDPKSQFLSESSDNSTQSIYIDHNKKIELVTKELAEKGPFRIAWNGLDPDPRTSNRWLSTYSPEERLIFYNYSIENTTGPPKPSEFTTLLENKQDEEKTLSYEEVLSQQRDAKRRRTKYKSIHINRKNYTEVIREVINGQMEEYKDWLDAQNPRNHDESSKDNGFSEDRKEDHERPNSSVSRNSNHSSSSRSTNRKSHRDSSRERYRRSKDKYDRKRHRSPSRYSDEERKHRRHRSRDRRHSRDREKRYTSRDNGRR